MPQKSMHTCEQKAEKKTNKKKPRHAQWDQLLLTDGPSWWHNNGVGEINTQTQRERKQNRTEGQKKEWKSEMDEVELGFQPWRLEEVDFKGQELSHQQHVMA